MTVPSKVNFCAIVLVESEIETTPGYAVISIFDQTWKNRSYTWLCHHLSFECISTFVSTKEEEGAPKNDRNGRHWENCKPDFFPNKTNVQAKKEGEGASKNNRNGRHQENIKPESPLEEIQSSCLPPCSHSYCSWTLSFFLFPSSPP
ncbi:hypothetical protein GUJ93_ZPchr0004g40076 [Zizania palustris]|uniref:Uncharacterized protein n=1 Tax=Zizania palustris TaxID=103762 RepID=A0A8J5VYY8_ZIZPA|nr:hypothetical protein GUJ93_ZPchr0004g40076 [Zizania palustris]